MTREVWLNSNSHGEKFKSLRGFRWPQTNPSPQEGNSQNRECSLGRQGQDSVSRIRNVPWTSGAAEIWSAHQILREAFKESGLTSPASCPSPPLPPELRPLQALILWRELRIAAPGPGCTAGSQNAEPRTPFLLWVSSVISTVCSPLVRAMDTGSSHRHPCSALFLKDPPLGR